MLRLVYTFSPSRLLALLYRAGLNHTQRIRFLTDIFKEHTYSLLLLAAFSLLPIVLKGQCNELICNQNVEVKLDADCIGEANPYFMLANYWSCTGPANMEYFDANGSPILNNEVNASHIGQTINVHMTHTWSGHDCWGTIVVVDKRKPTIEIDHVSLNCTEDTSVSAIGSPTAYDNCSNNVTVSHADSIISFGCGYTGFAGYFDPANWEECLINNGDGGVDVTGAPDQILVEGADSSPHSTSPKYVTKYKIAIPTEGYVSFDWSSFGGSSFDPQGFYLTINNWCIQLTNDSIQSGSYTTGLLYPGDVLSFEQVSDGDADAIHTLISNFHFHTLAWKVIHRTWSATDDQGNTRLYTQVVTQNRAALSQVVFPADRDGVAAPMLTCGAMADLSQTGQPFIDEDGDLNTTSDQYALDNGECAFNVAYEDQSIMTCEGSELVLRKWTIVDDCSSQILEHTQLIQLFDITPPVINCPSAQVVSTDNLGCFSNISLPQATAFDDCSSTITITPNWNFGSGYGPFGDIPPGTYPVNYEATDDCGNLATCATFVTIQDEVGPTVICDGQTVAALDNDGMAMVYANVVDDGSYDWCCIESFMIKQEGAPDTDYASALQVDCGNLGAPLQVVLKVTDCAGNFNTCLVEVLVQDDHDPVVLPPADITVDCTTDLSDLSLFGTATIYDNCGYTVASTYEESFSGCGEGAIIRSWVATDESGNETTAEQVITLDNLAPWNLAGNQINWPQDYWTTGCNLSLEPFDLPSPYAGPELIGQNGCESVTVSHTDEYFYIAEPSCYSLFRSWKIVDWCQYEPNSGSNTGVWEHIQVIEVLDTEAPEFVNPPTQITIQGNSGCSGEVVLDLPVVTDCSNHLTFMAYGELGTGFNYSNVAAGTYQMTFSAEDGCGNTATHDFVVSVGDEEAPTAYCLNGLTVGLGNAGETTVYAQTLDNGSFDNCSADLQFSFAPVPGEDAALFTCDELGQNLVQIYIFDDGGNMASCETFLMVMDNQQVCSQPEYIIAGLVQDPFGALIAETAVDLDGTSSNNMMTDVDGDFTFDQLPAGGNYLVSPSKMTDYLNGVTAYDLSKINSHILGVEVFEETWQYIAADANNSQHITVSDIVAIQNLILHNITMLPNGTPSWQYVPVDHIFTNPFNPWPFPANISMNDLNGDYLTADFTGIKVGDVSGNADPSMFTGDSEDRNSELLFIKITDQILYQGTQVELFFDVSEPVAAYQFSLHFDPAALTFIEKTSGNLAVGRSFEDRGLLTGMWYGNGATSFSLSFEVATTVSVAAAFRISDEKTKAIAWNLTDEAMDVMLGFVDPASSVKEDFILAQNTPNPFSDETSIQFNLPVAGPVAFRFFNAEGKNLYEVSGHYKQGTHALKVNQSNLQSSGLVFYEMKTLSGTKIGRMLLL